MRTALALLLSIAAVSCAQEPQKDSKRLSSVTWDLKTHKLIWEVQTGRQVDGEFEASSTARYEISPDDAVMQVLDERRGFTATEAKSLHRLLDTLSLYCAESVVWWDQGQGEKLEDGKPGAKPDPARPHPAPDSKRERVNRSKPKRPGPARHGELMAAAVPR